MNSRTRGLFLDLGSGGKAVCLQEGLPTWGRQEGEAGRHTDRETAEGQISGGTAPVLLASGFAEMPSYVSGCGRVPVATRDMNTFFYGAKKLNSGC